MISSEVQRTLVKSPPELWAELSDPTALSRHLGELGDIRIVRTEPESTVEWAAENATGTVSIKPSAWGTKVTLSVTRELDEPASEREPAAPEPEPVAVFEPELEPAVEHEPTAMAEPEPEPVLAPATPPPRRGFFARLFGRRAAPPVESDPIDAVASAEPPFELPVQAVAVERPAAVPEPAKSTPDSQPAGRAQEPQAPPGQPADISAELMAAEEVAAEEATAVLTAVLDRLGAAHHRPFSRA